MALFKVDGNHPQTEKTDASESGNEEARELSCARWSFDRQQDLASGTKKGG